MHPRRGRRSPPIGVMGALSLIASKGIMRNDRGETRDPFRWSRNSIPSSKAA